MSKLLLGLLLATAAVAVSAQSQQPPAGAQGQRQGNISTPAPQVATAPVALNVSVSPTVITKGPDSSEKNDNEGTDADWASVYWTAAATVIAFALLVLGWHQFRAEQKETRRNFILTHRPKLVVRDIEMPFADLVQSVTDQTDGNPTFQRAFAATVEMISKFRVFTGSLRVTNVGGSPATVVESRMQFRILERLPMRNPVQGGTEVDNLSIGTLVNGESKTVAFREDPIETQGGSIRPDRRLYVIGLIVYADEIGTKRRTGFARSLNTDSGRFESVNDTDYDYED